MELIVVCLLGMLSLASSVIVYRQNASIPAPVVIVAEPQYEQTPYIWNVVQIQTPDLSGSYPQTAIGDMPLVWAGHQESRRLRQ